MRRVLAAVVVAVALTACGGGGDADSSPTASGTIPDLVPGPGDPNQIGQTEAVACDIERTTLDAAVQVYAGLEGAPPASLQALLDEGLVTDEGGLAQRWEVVDGALQGVAGGPCEGR